MRAPQVQKSPENNKKFDMALIGPRLIKKPHQYVTAGTQKVLARVMLVMPEGRGF